MGLPLGYVGSPGLYVTNLASYGTNTAPGSIVPNAAKGSKLYVDTPIEVLSFRWTTPWTLFGARYAFIAVQPFVSQRQYGDIVGKGPTDTQTGGMHDTIISPAVLSWELPHKTFFSTFLRAGIPDGAIDGPTGLGNAAGTPYWMIQPGAAISYLEHGWDLSANLFYDFYTTNPYSHVTDGQVFRADFTATKKFGRLEIGPVGYLAFQTTRDTGGASPAAYAASKGALNTCNLLPSGAFNQCSRAGKAGIGGKIGYNFGAANLALLVTDSVLSEGVGGANGWRVWTQASFKLYDPPRPAPPVVAPVPE